MRMAIAVACLLLTWPLGSHAGEQLSPGELTVDLSETRFYPTAGTFWCDVRGARLARDPDSISILVNDKPLDRAGIHLSDKGIRVDYRFRSGLNEVLIEALDRDGLRLRADALVWAGAGGLLVTVSDPENRPVSGAAVTIMLNEQSAVRFLGTTLDGNLYVPNLPPRRLTIEARHEELATRQVVEAGASHADLQLGNPVR